MAPARNFARPKSSTFTTSLPCSPRDAIVAREEDVLGLQVAVHEIPSMGGTEGRAHAAENRSGPFRVESLVPGQVIPQGGTPQQLQHKERHRPIDDAEIVHCDDVRVRKRGRCTRLSSEPLGRVWRPEQIVPNDLDGHRTLEGRVGGLIDGAHAAATQPTIEPIAVDQVTRQPQRRNDLPVVRARAYAVVIAHPTARAFAHRRDRRERRELCL